MLRVWWPGCFASGSGCGNDLGTKEYMNRRMVHYEYVARVSYEEDSIEPWDPPIWKKKSRRRSAWMFGLKLVQHLIAAPSLSTDVRAKHDPAAITVMECLNILRGHNRDLTTISIWLY